MTISFQSYTVLGAALLLLPIAAQAAPLKSARPGPAARAAAADPMPAYGGWHSCRIGGGGYVQNVVLCPSNPRRAYAYVDVGGVYRSDDGGTHWRMLHGSLPARPGCSETRGLLVNPRNADDLVIAVGSQWSGPEGVYRSTDGGKSWTKTLTAPFFGNGPLREAGIILVRQPDAPDTLLAASVNAGVFRSTDSGATWKPCGAAGLYPTSLLWDAADPKRVYLCASALSTWYDGSDKSWPSAFSVSDDGGRSWRKTAGASPMEIVPEPGASGALVGIFDYAAVRRSADGGQTWTEYGQGLPLDPKAPNSYSDNAHTCALAAGPGFLVLATAHGLFFERRPGQAGWAALAEAGPNSDSGDWWGAYRPGQWSHVGAAVGSIVVDPRDPAHWYFTDWFGLYQSHNGGRRWALSIHGIESTVIHVLTPDPAHPGGVHLGMADNGYFRSADGGAAFRQGTAGITNNIKDIAVSPADPQTVYAVGPQSSGWYANQVFRSRDGGAHWTASPMTGLPDMNVARCGSVAADPRDPQTVYLGVSGDPGGGKGGPYRSRDGGQTWTWIGQGLPLSGGFFREDIFGGVGREIAAGADGSLVAVSHDTRQVWRRGAGDAPWTRCRVPSDAAPSAVMADGAGRAFYVCLPAGLFRSADGGQTWASVFGGRAAYVAVDAATPERLAVSTDTEIFWSTDSGAHWTRLDDRLPARTACPIAFAGNRLIAGSGGSGAFWIALPPAKPAHAN